MQGNGMGYHELIRILTSSNVVLYHDVAVVSVSFRGFVAGGGCKGDAASIGGAGEDVRDGKGDASVVRRPRSLMVNFCGFT